MSSADVFSRFSREAQEAILRAGLWARADRAMAIDVVHLGRALEPGSPPAGAAVALWTAQAKRALELALRHSLDRGQGRIGLEDLRSAILDQGSRSHPPETVIPPLQDSSGYRIRKRDLEFLAISTEQLAGWRQRSYPLGMSSITYPAFKDCLRAALLRDGLSLADCDVRLKGSAAEFFSGPHKLLPRTKRELARSFFEARQRTPDPWELDEIVDRLDRQWLSDGVGPQRRPFDSMHRLGIAQYRSDLDVQLSSDELVERCVELLAREGQGIEELTVKNPKYDFVQPYLVEKVAPHLYLFERRMTDRLERRSVRVKVFPSSGPAVGTDALSSHFRASDWQIDLRSAELESAA